jgi:hypothetical protein
VIFERRSVTTDDAANDQERYAGTRGTAEEKRTTADLVDKEERGECR